MPPPALLRISARALRRLRQLRHLPFPVETWDGTLAARKAIYIVKQTGERFGAVHLIDIMLGKMTERVEQWRHDSLSAFGRGTELSDKEWSSVFRQLVAMGFLQVDMERHGGIQLTPESAAVFQAQAEILLRKDPVGRRSRKERRGKTAASFTPDQKQEAAIFDALRAHRLELAAEMSVPPYIIFHDTTLRAMAVIRPQTLEEMRPITGVGESKLAKYGSTFLDVIISMESTG